jgi:two-component system, response regulator, stage 0 sporulation protein F
MKHFNCCATARDALPVSLSEHSGEVPSSWTCAIKTVVPRKRVLVADDDDMVRAALADVLESEGYEVNQARDGRETVARVVEDVPDLVLLDLNMPHLDGWAAFTQLDRLSPLVPIIVITARPHQYQEAVRLGVDAFMEKPLNIPVLLGAIKGLADEASERHVTRITNHRFTTRLLKSGYRGNDYPEFY